MVFILPQLMAYHTGPEKAMKFIILYPIQQLLYQQHGMNYSFSQTDILSLRGG